jgi:hypothetical protein
MDEEMKKYFDQKLSEIEKNLGERIDTSNKSLGGKIDKVEKSLEYRIEHVEKDIRNQNSDLRLEISKVEARSFNRIASNTPFTMEATPACLGNSATDPDYDIFRNEDYDL